MIVPGRLAILLGAVLTLLLLLAVVDSRVAILAIPADATIVGVCYWQGRRLRRLEVTVHPDRWPAHRRANPNCWHTRSPIGRVSRSSCASRYRFPAGIDAEQTTFELAFRRARSSPLGCRSRRGFAERSRSPRRTWMWALPGIGHATDGPPRRPS